MKPAVQTEWSSPIVGVKKSNGSVRICVDFRKLNQQIVGDKYPLPNIEDLFARLGTEKKYFAKIDLKNAYHQVPLSEEFQPLTTVVTHCGAFMYTRMPFGIKSAPSAFQPGLYGKNHMVFTTLVKT